MNANSVLIGGSFKFILSHREITDENVKEGAEQLRKALCCVLFEFSSVGHRRSTAERIESEEQTDDYGLTLIYIASTEIFLFNSFDCEKNLGYCLVTEERKSLFLCHSSLISVDPDQYLHPA